MDAETMKLLNEARMAVKTVNDNSVMTAVILVAVIGLTVLYMMYILDRWSWIPRKRHSRVFNERF